MEYRQAILKLNQFKSLGINLGLRRINDLLEIFGHPEEQFPIIHIGVPMEKVLPRQCWPPF